MRSSCLLAAVAAGILGFAAPMSHAQGPDAAGQIAADLLRMLEAQNYDTSGFESLTLVQVYRLHGMLVGRGGKSRLVQAILDGACGRASLETARPIPPN